MNPSTRGVYLADEYVCTARGHCVYGPYADSGFDNRNLGPHQEKYCGFYLPNFCVSGQAAQNTERSPELHNESTGLDDSRMCRSLYAPLPRVVV